MGRLTLKNIDVARSDRIGPIVENVIGRAGVDDEDFGKIVAVNGEVGI